MQIAQGLVLLVLSFAACRMDHCRSKASHPLLPIRNLETRKLKFLKMTDGDDAKSSNKISKAMRSRLKIARYIIN